MAERWWPVCIDCGDTSDSKRIGTNKGFMCADCHEETKGDKGEVEDEE